MKMSNVESFLCVNLITYTGILIPTVTSFAGAKERAQSVAAITINTASSWINRAFINI